MNLSSSHKAMLWSLLSGSSLLIGCCGPLCGTVEAERQAVQLESMQLSAMKLCVDTVYPAGAPQPAAESVAKVKNQYEGVRVTYNELVSLAVEGVGDSSEFTTQKYDAAKAKTKDELLKLQETCGATSVPSGFSIPILFELLEALRGAICELHKNELRDRLEKIKLPVWDRIKSSQWIRDRLKEVEKNLEELQKKEAEEKRKSGVASSNSNSN